MTREEAISVLKVLASFQGVMEYLEQHSVSVQDACNMAIQALSQEPCDDATLKDIFCMGCEYREQEPCDDAISREALIAKLTELIKTSRSTIEIKAKLIPMIEQLPSVSTTKNIVNHGTMNITL